MTTDLPPVRLTPGCRAVLTTLVAIGPGWHPVADLARAAGVGVDTCRKVLAELLAARVVQRQTQPGFDRRPPRAVYQLARGGRALVASLTDQ